MLAGMTPTYSRPAIADREFVDEFGRPVVYGRRRHEAPEHGPRDGEANVLSHQERYEPIFTVAEALIAHLAATYDVVVGDDLRQSSRFDIMREAPDASFARVVSIRPVAPTEAPLVIGFHDQPGSVRVLAGWYSEFDMWFCGCDACDEPWEDVADSLEDVILHVAERGTTERLDSRAWGSAHYRLDPSRRRMWGGSIAKRAMRPEILKAANNSSRELGDGRWLPWTPRTSDASVG
ncbi:hypothetical protein B1729_05280 [Microbacterium sp. B35-04]|nr:hypothetical protein B1729_05280 [Microbacterium sp. B35-04]